MSKMTQDEFAALQKSIVQLVKDVTGDPRHFSIFIWPISANEEVNYITSMPIERHKEVVQWIENVTETLKNKDMTTLKDTRS